MAGVKIGTFPGPICLRKGGFEARGRIVHPQCLSSGRILAQNMDFLMMQGRSQAASARSRRLPRVERAAAVWNERQPSGNDLESSENPRFGRWYSAGRQNYAGAMRQAGFRGSQPDFGGPSWGTRNLGPPRHIFGQKTCFGSISTHLATFKCHQNASSGKKISTFFDLRMSRK